MANEAGQAQVSGGALRKMVRRPDGVDPRLEAAERKAWEAALIRAARPYPELTVALAGVDAVRGRPPADLLAGMDAGGLLLPLDPPRGAGSDHARGALRLDPGLIDALIEVQTLGAVAPAAAPARPATRIDAALTRDFAEVFLAAVLGNGPVPRPDLRVGEPVERIDALSLILTAPRYDRFTVTVSVAEARTAVADLILPAVAAVVPARSGPPLITALGPAEVALEAILARFELPLGRLAGLAVGTELPLPLGVTLDDVRLVDAGGAAVMAGRLGRLGGARAVRLHRVAADGEDGPAAGAPRAVSAAVEGAAMRTEGPPAVA